MAEVMSEGWLIISGKGPQVLKHIEEKNGGHFQLTGKLNQLYDCLVG